MNKYRNTKVMFLGQKFDSKSERDRYLVLLDLQKKGEISDLKRQVKFELIPKAKGERGANYIADFVYSEKSQLIAEDVKSVATAKNQTYILKRKLFKLTYPEYYFREVVL